LTEVVLTEQAAEAIRRVQPPIVAEVRGHLMLLQAHPLVGQPATGDPRLPDCLVYDFIVKKLPVRRRFALLYRYVKAQDRVEVLDFVGVRPDGTQVRGPTGFDLGS
jgi:hypothetical protein